MRKIFFSFFSVEETCDYPFRFGDNGQNYLFPTKNLLFRENVNIPRKKNGSSSKSLKFHYSRISLLKLTFLYGNNYSNMLGFYIDLQAQSCKNVNRYSTIVVIASGCQCQSCNSPGFDPPARRNMRGGR
jgi:hypothetical protein